MMIIKQAWVADRSYIIYSATLMYTCTCIKHVWSVTECSFKSITIKSYDKIKDCNIITWKYLAAIGEGYIIAARKDSNTLLIKFTTFTSELINM